MRLLAVSLLGVLAGVVWVGASLGECDRAHCGPLHDALHATSPVGGVVLLLALGGVVTAGVRAVARRRRRAPRTPAPAWAVGLTTASATGLGLLGVYVADGVGAAWTAALAGVGGIAAAVAQRARTRAAQGARGAR